MCVCLGVVEVLAVCAGAKVIHTCHNKYCKNKNPIEQSSDSKIIKIKRTVKDSKNKDQTKI